MSSSQSKPDEVTKPATAELEKEDTPTFSPEEVEALVKESNAAKEEANVLFSSKQYNDALEKYEEAMSTCPKHIYYPRAVIQSNVAACHLKLEEWKEAIKAASAAIKELEELERTDPLLNPDANKENEKGKEKAENEEDEDVEEEIISSGASKAAPAPESKEDAVKALKDNILRIRLKSMMRRARACSEAGGWHNLTTAEADYKALAASPETLSPADLRIVRTQLRELPPRVKVAQEKEMAEMWGKLKNLGNGILKPFGLSTDNFQMTKDEKSGGYSMNFQPGGSSQ
ncbi:hypothetical protein NM208_g13562 [Fusarium decemcellulare]|uniref:Uncharacterized protein n=1 Tax=Fusarium decemcellulare TaxID=57161 RepID=A0ACC1RL67_9HYPO|nr:hypothetical protein NM208_g13562 [Fusarium decemcellulare]